MVQCKIYGAVLLVGTVLCLSIPTSAIAQRHNRHTVGHNRQAVRHNRYAVRHNRQAERHNRYAVRHRPHGRHRSHRSGFQIGLFVGGLVRYGHYPHGHHLHVHGPYCPVVIEKHVYHHAYASPTWHVYYDTQRVQAPLTILYISVTPGYGDLYVDGRHLGQVRRFRDGSVQLPVSAGRHVVQWHHNGSAYSRQVDAKAGSTTIVTAQLER